MSEEGQETIKGNYNPGDQIDGRFTVVKIIGKGGMGEVYLVEDAQLNNKRKALKLLHRHMSENKNYVSRFKNEVMLTQALDHDNIVRVFDLGETPNGEYYFTMEFVEGRSLGEILDEHEEAGTKLPLDQSVSILYKLSETLDYAHKMNVVHRDLKPDNIIITSDNRLKLTDFGISRSTENDMGLTATGQMLGTPYYMAPEQFKSSKVDGRADIYSLGIMAYELAAGKRPFDYEEYHTLYVAHLTEEIPKLSTKDSGIPLWYEDLVDSCTAKEPEKRFKNAEELSRFLKVHAADLEGDFFSKNLSRMPFFLRRLVKLSSHIASKYAISIILGFLNLCLFIPLLTSPSLTIGDSLDMALLDRAFRIRGEVPTPEQIEIIAVDEESYEEKGVSVLRPWPRKYYAELLEKMSAHKPKKIIIDYRFAKTDDPVISDPAGDQQLAEAMQDMPVYISHFLEEKDGKFIMLENDERFEKSAAGLYFANLIDYGVVRQFNTTTKTKNRVPPIARVLYGQNADSQKLPDGNSLIKYYGPARTFKPMPFHKALTLGEELPPDHFKDKIVFIGQVLKLGYQMAQRDTFMTPFGTYTAGVEIHATMAGNILEKSWIQRLPLQHEATAILLLSILITYLFLTIRPRYALYTILIATPLWCLIFYFLFKANYFFPGALLFLPLMPAAYMVAILISYLQDLKLRKGLGV